jgi:hypothetical protein
MAGNSYGTVCYDDLVVRCASFALKCPGLVYARAYFYCTYVVCTLCITTDIRIITVYKDNSSQIKSSKTAAFAKPANREKLIGGGGGALYVWVGLAAAAALLEAPRLVFQAMNFSFTYVQIC